MTEDYLPKTKLLNILKIDKEISKEAYSSVAIHSQAKLWQSN
jgi:hypothetical protein